ncbi:MAG: TonB-dependent receptor domain-containing protein [Gammaproteobacteria bacterium]
MSLKNHVMLVVGLAILALPVWAQDAVEEIVVTGSYIKHSPEDAPVPIDVIDSEELFNTGSPSVVELVKTLGVSSGVDGESNYFQSNGLGGTANVNLRGLGAGRNLVLLNGRRNVFSPYAIAEQQQLFVDINMIPGIALDRVELLKDGAAATYGSDAISGVVNFITRADFEGLEFALSHKDIDGSDGDQNFGVIWGQDFGRTHAMVAFGYTTRNQLQIRDRDWAIHRRGENGNFRGYSSSPNPGAFLDWRAFRTANPTAIPSQDNIRTSKTTEATPPATQFGYIDPRCTDISGGFAANDGRCTYNYTYFDNLIEEEKRNNFYATLAHEFADDMQLNVEFLYGKNEVPNWYTSPSYPPQLDFDTRLDTGRFVHAYHPGLVAFVASTADYNGDADGNGNPFATLESGDATFSDAGCDVETDSNKCRRLLFYGRPLGAAGPSEKRGFREYETTRLVVGLDGTFDNGVDYITSLLWSEANGKRAIYDAVSERWSEALEGYGLCGRLDAEGNARPVSDRADKVAESDSTAGCVFHNPFTNAIERPQQKYTADFDNEDYSADLANPYELYEWMSDGVGADATSTLAVWDGILTGESANGVGWALGAQYRQEQYKLTPNDISNLHLNPCATVAENTEFRDSGRAYNPDGINCAGEDGKFDESDDNYTGSGPFTFLAGETPFDDKQDVTAIFGELLLPSTDNIELQLSARYEDYGGDVGSSFDPKIALRWQVMDNLALRGSASSTFRAPTLNQLGGRTTALSFLSAAGTFKAVDSIGSAGLDPEKATTINLGVLFDADDMFTGNDNLRFSVDYWSFDFTDPIIREDFNAIANSVFSGKDGAYTGGAYAERILCGAAACTDKNSALDLTRIRTFIVNGPAIETNGFDIAAGYSFDALQGEWDVSLQLTSISAFDVAASDLNPDGIDALGKLNDAISFLRPIVENKAKFGVRYNRGAHLLNFMANYTGSYQDAQNSAPDRKIADHTTFDLHYNLSLENIGDNLAQSAVWVSVYNLTDEDPPIARLDMNYDPYTHNPFGQIIKIGVRHKF